MSVASPPTRRGCEALRGTYAGLAHPTTLAYLQGLGITSIELLPIMAKQDELFLQEHGRKNYWGYSHPQLLRPRTPMPPKQPKRRARPPCAKKS